MSRTIAAPTIHFGGTARQDLLDGLSHAKLAMLMAIEQLKLAQPHPRDYPCGMLRLGTRPPQTADDYELALVQHQSRILKLEILINELEVIQARIVLQDDNRGR